MWPSPAKSLPYKGFSYDVQAYAPAEASQYRGSAYEHPDLPDLARCTHLEALPALARCTHLEALPI